jgi:hypothetical protein
MNKFMSYILIQKYCTFIQAGMSGAVMLGGSLWSDEKVKVSHSRHSYPRRRKKENAIVAGITLVDINLNRQSVLDKT